MADEISITRKNTENFIVTVSDANGAFDITGYTAKFTAKKNRTDPDSKAIIGPVTCELLEASEGTITISLSTENTDVPLGTYFYDLKITDGTNYYTVLNSTITVNSTSTVG